MKHQPETAGDATRLAYGVVSPSINTGVAHGQATVGDMAPGAVNHAAAHSGFNYHGGPVVRCPLVYVSFWGSAWTSTAAQLTRASRLMQFHQDMLASKYMNVLSQYGAGVGAGSGAVVRATFINNVPNNLTAADITNTLQAAINAGALPEPGNPSNQCVMVILSDGMSVDAFGARMCQAASDNAFGFHSFFTTTHGNKCYFAIIPGLNDACLHASCTTDAGCSLHLTQTQEQRQTQVASHEFCEMASDPELNAWFEDGGGSENSDIVNGQSATISVNGRTWTVQRQYSKFDDIASNGSNFSVVESPNPLAKLAPGPAASTSPAAKTEVLSYARLLPLPAVHFDAAANTTSMDDAHLTKYARQVFFPLRPEHIVADFPTFLTQVVSAMSKKK